MNAALTEIFAFFVFLILLMDVAQYHRDPNTYLLTKTLSETFDEVDDYSIDLAAVSACLCLGLYRVSQKSRTLTALGIQFSKHV